ncbi:MAG: hypothetical protein HKM95_09215 [Inquilinus sp.]|nr:hypothetical protein [Inquilinus sp.]
MTPADRLRLAKGYPYRIERRSFRYVDGGARPETRLHHADRVPVVAYGSNRSPEQLARKYAGWPVGTEIPVTLAWLADHDVVHSAHFARYGAVPAMLFPAAGVRVEVAVMWLTPPQLTRMHETEGAANYAFGLQSGLDLRDEAGGRLETAGVYVGRHGALARDTAPLPLAAVAAEGRRDRAGAQVDALTAARDRLAPEAPLDRFILQNVTCPVTRADRSRRLRREALEPDRFAPKRCKP